MFDFLNLKPKKESPMDNSLMNKYPWRENIKSAITYLSQKGYYNPNHPRIAANTNERVFDILASNLDEKIDWARVAIFLDKKNEHLFNAHFFDVRPYCVISSYWELTPLQVTKAVEITKELAPSLWRLDIDNNELVFESIVYYPFYAEVFENAIANMLFFEDAVLRQLTAS